jgi:hypothetical protein
MGWNSAAGRGMGRGFRFRNTLPRDMSPVDIDGEDREKRSLRAQVSDLLSRRSLLEQRLANSARAPETPTAES